MNEQNAVKNGVNYGYISDIGKNGADCYSKNGHAVTVLTVQS